MLLGAFNNGVALNLQLMIVRESLTQTALHEATVLVMDDHIAVGTFESYSWLIRFCWFIDYHDQKPYRACWRDQKAYAVFMIAKKSNLSHQPKKIRSQACKRVAYAMSSRSD